MGRYRDNAFAPLVHDSFKDKFLMILYAFSLLYYLEAEVVGFKTKYRSKLEQTDHVEDKRFQMGSNDCIQN